MDLMNVVLYVIAAGAICALLWWLVGFAADRGVLPAPFIGFAQVAIAVVAVLLLINLIIGFMGGHTYFPLRMR